MDIIGSTCLPCPKDRALFHKIVSYALARASHLETLPIIIETGDGYDDPKRIDFPSHLVSVMTTEDI